MHNERQETQAASLPPHSAALLTVLEDTWSGDLRESYVYGSAHRPLSHAWVRIAGASILDAGERAASGFYSYVCVPEPLPQAVITAYELTPISRPATMTGHGQGREEEGEGSHADQ